MAYLYVLWAVEDHFVKIGIGRNRLRRARSHSANASNPLDFQIWRLYQLESLEDAQALETGSLKALRASGYGYKSKRELFTCRPSKVTETIERVAQMLGISILKNYPQDFEHMVNMGLDFVDLPYQLFEVPSRSERDAYFMGAAAVLLVLGSLEGLNLSAREIQSIGLPHLDFFADGREMWRNLLDQVSIVVGRDEARQSIIAQARRKIENEQLEAFNRWQEIDDDESEEAA